MRETLIVILNECEGSVSMVRKAVRHHNDGGTLSIIMTENIKRHSERQRRIYYRGEESGKKIKAISCELSAISC